MTSIDPDFSNALVFTGGGTGGHYFPAVALAQGARQRWASLPIVFVGAKRGLEAAKLPESGWSYLLLDVEGFLGRSPLQALNSLRKLRRAVTALTTRWKTQRPRMVIATGGYAAAPALFAARFLGIPYFLHESNAEPGWLIRLLAPRAQRVWCGMAVAKTRLPRARCEWVGTPVREAFLREFVPTDSLKPPHRLLVLGGSGGARALNEALLALAPELLERFPEWEILHQCGVRHFDELAPTPCHPRHRLVPFIESVDLELEASSLVISRSGASTCAELKACGRPAILVPFPASAGDHQRLNARAMEADRQAVVVEQGIGFQARLLTGLAELMGDSDRRLRLARPEPNHALDRCLGDLASRI